MVINREFEVYLVAKVLALQPRHATCCTPVLA